MAAIFATMVAGWNLGLPRLVPSPEQRHVSGIADPFSRPIDEFRIVHVQRSDGWIETTWNNMSDPGAFAAAGAEEQDGGMASRHRLQAPVWSSA